MTAPGWYPAEGDPPGTVRYWDGNDWVSEPVAQSAAHGGPGMSGPPAVPGQPGLHVASSWRRIGARLIDWVVFIIIFLVALSPAISDAVDGLSALPDNASDAQIEAVLEDAFSDREGNIVIALAIVFFLDFLLLATLSATIGKLIVGLRTVDATTGHQPLGFPKAFLRTLNAGLLLIASSSVVPDGIEALVSITVFLVALASLIMLFANDRNRTVMDLIAGTVVIRNR